jgi:branched-chain amino acid transport system substrate-binding protein
MGLCFPSRARRLPHLGGFQALLFPVVILAASSAAWAQSDPPAAKPYATLDRQSVVYLGPIRSTEKELPEGAAVIGLILPLGGPRQAEGEALLTAAQLALQDEQSSGPLPDGRKLALVARDESGPWGQASTETLKLIEQDHAVALLTSANGNSAHLAEQIANKIGLPIVTLASDPTTTQTNIPWIFRLGPSDTDQAHAFCRRIYTQLGLQKVLLIVQMDHDGRIGGVEFEKAAVSLKATHPIRLELAAAAPNIETASAMIQSESPDAIVIWTNAPVAEALLPLIHRVRPSAPVFLSWKAAQMVTVDRNRKPDLEEFFTIDSLQNAFGSISRTFQERYLSQTGTKPSIGATKAYEAVRLIASSMRSAGANRVQLRDYFTNEGKFRGTPHLMPFDPAGNSVQEFAIVEFQAPVDASPGK